MACYDWSDKINPYPCGFLGDAGNRCNCNPAQIQRYESRISGPLIDRIDIHLEVPVVAIEEMRGSPTGEPSAVIKARVDRAREIQKARFAASHRIHFNSQMGPKEIECHCRLDPPGLALLEKGVKRLGLSARAYHRILKIARTIADMDGAAQISSANIAEAVQYRRFDRKPSLS